MESVQVVMKCVVCDSSERITAKCLSLGLKFHSYGDILAFKTLRICLTHLKCDIFLLMFRLWKRAKKKGIRMEMLFLLFLYMAFVRKQTINNKKNPSAAV